MVHQQDVCLRLVSWRIIKMTNLTKNDENKNANEVVAIDEVATDNTDKQETEPVKDESEYNEPSLKTVADNDDDRSEFLALSMGSDTTQDYLALAHKYTKSQAKTTLFLAVACLILLIMFIIVLSVLAGYPKTKVLPVLNAQAVCEIKPQNNPALNDVVVSQFAQQAIVQTNSFSFADSEEKIEWATSSFYTQKGRLQAVTAIKKLGLLDSVSENLFTLKAGLDGVPSVADIVEKKDGSKEWTIKVPLRLEVYGATKTPLESQSILATVRVVSFEATKVNPTGLAIDEVRYQRLN